MNLRRNPNANRTNRTEHVLSVRAKRRMRMLALDKQTNGSIGQIYFDHACLGCRQQISRVEENNAAWQPEETDEAT